MMLQCILFIIGGKLIGWLTKLNYAAHVFNSTFNLPLYLFFSSEMRKTFFKILRENPFCSRRKFPTFPLLLGQIKRVDKEEEVKEKASEEAEEENLS